MIQQRTHATSQGPDDPPKAKLDKLEALLHRAGESGSNSAPLVADLLGLDAGKRYGKLDLTPQVQRLRALNAFVQQLLDLAAKQPVRLVLEDAHWIDPTTLEVVEQWLDQIADARV